MFTISITEKGGKKRQMDCAKPLITIGRLQGNDIVLPLGNVSKQHAQIQHKEKEFVVMDIGSTNGTYLNGRKIAGPTPLQEGDKVYVGEFIVSVASAVPNKNEAVTAEFETPQSRPAIPPPVPKPRKSTPPIVQNDADSTRNRASKIIDKLSENLELPSSNINMNSTISPTKPLSVPPAPQRQSTAPPLPAQTDHIPQTVEQLIDFVALEEPKINRSSLPSVSDEKMAAKVRNILNGMISRLEQDGKLTPSQNPGSLFMESFASIVNMGPLSNLLLDSSICQILINGYDNVTIRTQNNEDTLTELFESNQQLHDALHCLIAGLDNGNEFPRHGQFALETGDLLFFQTEGFSNKIIASFLRKPKEIIKFPIETLEALQTVIVKNGNIAITSDSISSSVLLLESLISQLPPKRIATIERVPLIKKLTSACIAIHGNPQMSASEIMEEMVYRAFWFSPQWIVARGESQRDFHSLQQLTNSKVGLLAVMPNFTLDTSIENMSLPKGSKPSNSSNHQSFIDSNFDLLIICRDRSDLVPTIERVIVFDNAGSSLPQMKEIPIKNHSLVAAI